MQYGATLDAINMWAWRGVCVMGAIIVVQLIVDIAKAGYDAWRRRSITGNY